MGLYLLPLGSCVSLFVQMRLFGFTGEAAAGPWSMGWSDCLPDAYGNVSTVNVQQFGLGDNITSYMPDLVSIHCALQILRMYTYTHSDGSQIA